MTNTITDRRRNVTKSRMGLRRVVETAINASRDAIIVMNGDGKTIVWNDAAETMFGFSRKEVLGRDCHEFIMPDAYKDAHNIAFSAFQKTGSGPAVNDTVKVCAKRKSGEEFPVELSISSFKVGENWSAAAIVRDISEQVEREGEFAQTAANYLALIDTVPASMYLKDIDHKYVIANKAFCDLAGKPLSDIIGKTDYEIFQWDKADLHHVVDRKIFEGGKSFNEQAERICDSEGNERWISTTKVPLHDNQGLVSGLAAISQDVTEQHLAREQLVQSDKLAAIGTLAAGVAHEINNPIGFISSNLGTMKKYLSKVTGYLKDIGIDSTENADSLKDILDDFGDAIDESIEGADRVRKIVADLKSFSRVDKSEMEMVNINIGLESTLNIVWNELKYTCVVEKDLGDIPDLYCLPNQLNQVFLNLLVNAGHAINGDDGKIVIKTWADDKSINVSIKDNGSGIPRNTLGKIFEPFFTTKEVGRGTGLGLSLTYDIVKKHGGVIDVESEVGIGSTFTLRLPIEGIDRGRQDNTAG